MKLSREVWALLGLLLFVPMAAVTLLTAVAAGWYFADGYGNNINHTALLIAMISMAFISSYTVTKVMTWGDREYFKELKMKETFKTTK